MKAQTGLKAGGQQNCGGPPPSNNCHPQNNCGNDGIDISVKVKLSVNVDLFGGGCGI